MLSRSLGALLLLALASTVGAAGCAAPTDDDADSADSATTQKQAGYTLGMHEGPRDTTGTYFQIDTQKVTYSTKGKLTVHAFIEKATQDEGADIANSDVFRMDFEVTFDEYVRLFERSEPFKIGRRPGRFYTESAEAEGALGHRKIVFHWDNEGDGDDRKGELEIDQGPNGSITYARLQRWSKTFIVPFWHSIFEARVKQPAAKDGGLLLIEDATGDEYGRVRSAENVKRAVDDPSDATFERVAGH